MINRTETYSTAASLIARIRDKPELVEAMRVLLNKEVGRPNNAARDAEIAQRVWNGESRRDIAHEYQLSMPRVNQILQMNPNPNPPKELPNAARDRLILDQASKGIPRAAIAKEHNLSVVRINQIVGGLRFG
jgi:DNA-binding NarL/FixJ family response regulator